MRVLFLNQVLGYFGGAEQNVAHAARELAVRGHACLLAHAGVRGRGPEAYAGIFKDAAPCRELGGQGQGWELLLQRWRSEVVYAHKVERLPWPGRRSPLRGGAHGARP